MFHPLFGLESQQYTLVYYPIQALISPPNYWNLLYPYFPSNPPWVSDCGSDTPWPRLPGTQHSLLTVREQACPSSLVNGPGPGEGSPWPQQRAGSREELSLLSQEPGECSPCTEPRAGRSAGRSRALLTTGRTTGLER